MQYLPTAFAQLAFALKLWNYAENGKINLDELDIPLIVEEGKGFLALPERIFDTHDDFLNAIQNNITIAFGAAAITLNRSREEAGYSLTDPIQSETEQFIAAAYQLRNAFAHDIAEPRWKINQRFRRIYEFGGIRIDLSNVHEKVFEYADIGGPDILFKMKNFAEENLWAR